MQYSIRIRYSEVIRYLFLFISTLLVTELYRLVLIVMNVNSFIFNVFSLFGLMLIALFYFKEWAVEFNQSAVFRWMVMILFLWPILHVIFSLLLFPSRLVIPEIWLGRYLTRFFLFVNFIALFKSGKSKSIIMSLRTYWMVVILGVFASYFLMDLFHLAALHADKTGIVNDLASRKTRAVGLNLQSNVASYTLLIVYFMYVIRKGGADILTFALSFLAVVLTGSRAAFVIFVILNVLLFLTHKNLKVRISLFRLNVLYVAIPCVLIGIIFLGEINSGINAIDRLNFLSEDTSTEGLDSRGSYVASYLEYIAENPFFGYGPDYSDILQKQGVFKKSSHNIYTESGFAFGVFYPLALIWMLFKLYRRTHHKVLGITVSIIFLLFGLTHSTPLANDISMLMMATVYSLMPEEKKEEIDIA